MYNRENSALNLNTISSDIDIHLTTHGSDWLWAVFSVFALLTVGHTAYLGYLFRKGTKNIVVSVPLLVSIIFTLSYFTYASNLGWTSTPVEFNHVTTDEELGIRQIFYVKFVAWFCAFPLVLTMLEYSVGEIGLDSLFSLLTKVLVMNVFVVNYLIGSLIKSTYKWGYWVFGTFGLLLGIVFVGHSLIRSEKKTIFILGLTGLQLLIWVLYPVAWGLSEGGNVIQPDSEAVFYGILDLINFGFLPLLFLVFSTKDEIAHEKTTETPRVSGETAV